MNSENAPKEMVQSFIGLANVAKGLTDENQQTSVTKELRRLLCSTRGGGRRNESREFLRVGAGEPSASVTDANNTSFTTRSTIKRTKYGDQKQHQRNHESPCHIKQPQEKIPVKLLFFPCKTQ